MHGTPSKGEGAGAHQSSGKKKGSIRKSIHELFEHDGRTINVF